MARSTRLESGIQDQIVAEIKANLPGCMVFKMDYPQGIPDLLILYKKRWASLETKRYYDSHKQPNQPYYVDLMDYMSFSRFINKENKEEVLNELYTALRSEG